MNMPLSLGDWMPVGVSCAPLGCAVEWCDFSGVRMSEPFFDQTVTRLLNNPCRNLCRFQTTMERLCDLVPQADSRPAGVVFHMSRCGSTLVSGMLKALPQHVVLSEPAPLAQLLLLRRRIQGVPEETWRRWLSGLLNVMGRRRHAGEECWFLKCDALHTLDLPFIMSSLPEVPWVFIHRDPVEVIAAHLDTPARVMVPGSTLPGMESFHSPVDTDPAEHIARILAEVCRAALEAPAEKGLFIDYRRLPHEAWPDLARHFHLDVHPGDDALLCATGNRDAKNPDRSWRDDRTAKRAFVTPAVQATADRWLGEIFKTLASR